VTCPCYVEKSLYKNDGGRRNYVDVYSDENGDDDDHHYLLLLLLLQSIYLYF
jgi:hypothetical protein